MIVNPNVVGVYTI